MAETKLQNYQIDYKSDVIQTATCSTASATSAKVAVLSTFVLMTNSKVTVTFTNANTVSGAITLNVNSTGAKPIYNELGAVSASNPAMFTASVPIEFIYDGTNDRWTYRKYQDEFAKTVGGAPMFTCRAWVNFNGSGTPAIRASGNVSSITDNGLGNYTVNFTQAMPDTSYAVVAMSSNTGGDSGTAQSGVTSTNRSTGSTTLFNRYIAGNNGSTGTDADFIAMAVFR